MKYTEQEIAELREFARAYGFELELEQREPAAVPAELRVEEFFSRSAGIRLIREQTGR